MVVEVNKKLTEQEVNELLEKMHPEPKHFDARKYFNKIKIEGDPLQVQQDMRDE